MRSDTTRLGDFARLAWANLAAQTAEQIALASAAIVAVLLLGAGDGEVALLQMVLSLPYLLFALPAGVLADRFARTHLLVGAEALRAAALLAIIGLIEADLLRWPVLALLGFVAACGTIVFSVAAPALVPSLVRRDRLARANARLELARTVAFAGGPALGGVLVGMTGPAIAFAMAAWLSILSAVLLRGVAEPARVVAPRRHPASEVAEGIAFVARHALLRPIFLTQLVFNTSNFILLAVFVPYAMRRLALSPAAIGVTLGMVGAGMIVGALLAPLIMKRLPFGAIIGVGPSSGLVGAVVLAATIQVPSVLLAGLGFFLLGVGPVLWVIATTTLRQAVTPPTLLGRVSSVAMLATGARPLGAGIGALIGWQLGAEACLIAAALGFFVQWLVIWTSPVVRLRRQPELPADEVPGSAGHEGSRPRAAGTERRGRFRRAPVRRRIAFLKRRTPCPRS